MQKHHRLGQGHLFMHNSSSHDLWMRLVLDCSDRFVVLKSGWVEKKGLGKTGLDKR